MKALVATTLSAIAVALCAAPALAHVDVAATNPKAGASLKQAPAKVTVTFTGQIRRGTIVVTHGGEAVSRSPGGRDPANVRRLRVALRSGLDAGRYTVRWTAVAADGHRLTGSFRFMVR
jgi:methionine-rich copper-binding protein CopC